MRKSFKYRLRPSKKQASFLQQSLDDCRWLYNECLEQRILSYEERGFHRYKSFCYPQSGFSLDGKALKVSKVGNLKVVLHRPVEGTIKTRTISKNAVGEWYVSFSCAVTPQTLPRKDTVVGIDLGITTFATLSDKKDIRPFSCSWFATVSSSPPCRS